MSETICSTSDSASASAGASPPSVRWRLAAAGVILALAAGVGVWIVTGTWQQMNRLKQDLAVANLESFFLGVHLHEGVLRMNGALFRFQLSGDDAERTSFRSDAGELGERLRRTKAHLNTDSERRIVADVEKAFDDYLKNTAGYLERGLRGIRRDTASIVHQELSQKAEPLVALADQLVQVQQSALHNFFGSSQGAVSSLQRLLLLSVMIPIVLAAGAVVFLHRATIAPLRLQLDQTRSILERKEKLASLGVLAAGVAHEVRNPLTAIKFRLFSLKSSLPEEFSTNEDLAIVHSEINRLERIVKDFLQFARPSDPHFADVSVGLLLHEVHDLLKAEMDRRSIELRTDPANALAIRADKQQIQQVLINLIQNAADSIHRGGVITLAARQGVSSVLHQAQPMVTLEVSDTGKGIPPEVEKRIFDPFFSTKEGGTGLGLSIAARIIEKHGGFIQYLTRLNQGTTFSLVLPKATRDESPSPAH